MPSDLSATAARTGPIGWYIRAMRFLAGTSMLAIVVIMTAQVVARYLFNASLIWAEELCRVLLVWQTFLFVGLAYQRGELVAVDVLPELLTPKLRLALKILVSIPVLAFLGLMAVNGYDYASRFQNQVIPAVDFIWMSVTGDGLGVSVFWVYVSVCVGSALLGLHVVASIVGDAFDIRAGRAAPSTLHPHGE
jgi:TRAP-type C4-dicarboxylate transport system permease small subunit